MIFRAIYFHVLRNACHRKEAFQEHLNILREGVRVKDRIISSLPEKIERASFLFEASQELVELVEPETILDFLIEKSKKLFFNAECISLFILDNHRQELQLQRIVSLRQVSISDYQQGESLEKWVLKNNASVIVENIVQDFRFDANLICAYLKRKMHSFILSPISIGERIYGVMRLEAKEPLKFSLDDLRLLRAVCDLGAIVLEKASLFAQTRQLATKDALTNLYLKEAFLNELNDYIKNHKSLKVGIIILDIDDFKEINDNHGHIVGDLVLKRLAQCLVENVGLDERFKLCRFGGEEFVVALFDGHSYELYTFAEKLRRSIEKQGISFRRKTIHFTVSLGLAIYPQENGDLIEVLRLADKRLYKAKGEGKNKLCFTE